MPARIKSIDIRNRRCYIRFGKNEIEIDGGKAALRDWIRETAASITAEQLIALRLREHLKADNDLNDLAKLYGKEIDLTVSEKAVT